MLVPGAWSVQRGHDLVEDFELALATRLGPVAVLTHLEPIEDPLSQDDAALERVAPTSGRDAGASRSEEHTSELQSLMRNSYAVFCLKKKNKHKHNTSR